MVLSMKSWLEEQVWERAREPAADAITVTAVVVDEQLGSLVVMRLPCGHEVIGADSPPVRPG